MASLLGRIKKLHVGEMALAGMGLVLALAALQAGCGNNTSEVGTAATGTSTDPLATTTAQSGATAISGIATKPAIEAADNGAQQVGATQPAAQAMQIVSQSVSPAIVQKGGTVTFSVTVKGNAKKVTMVYGQAGGDASTSYNIVSLQAAGNSGGISTWTGPAVAQFDGTGTRTFFYYAIALTQDDQEVKTPGNPEAYQTYTVQG